MEIVEFEIWSHVSGRYVEGLSALAAECLYMIGGVSQFQDWFIIDRPGRQIASLI